MKGWKRGGRKWEGVEGGEREWRRVKRGWEGE